MITQFRLENFKGHRDTELTLRPFTVLVGDNSSGKTSVLEALRLPGRLADGNSPDELLLDGMIRSGTNHIKLSFSGTTDGDRWSLVTTISPPNPRWTLHVEGDTALGPLVAEESIGWPGLPTMLRPLHLVVGPVALYRFHSDQVAASAYSDHADAAVAETGELTAVALAAIKLADDTAFNAIENAMRRLVPSLRRVFIRPTTLIHPSNPNPVTGSKLFFDFQGAKNVPAHHASQGTLVALALLTVLHGRERPSVILLDDFDHALHPRAQTELVRMIKELLALDGFRNTQVLATTHSPYVLDEVSPEDVIAFALRDDGTVAAKPLSEHPDARKLNGSLKTGELWSLDAERDWVR